MQITNAETYLMNLAMGTNGATFASLDYTSKETGERARYTVLIGADYAESYRKDAETIAAALPNLTGIELEAAQEIHSSLSVSLAGGLGNNPAYTQADQWENVGKGFRVNKTTGAIQLLCSVVSKTVLVPGVYKVVKSRPLTIAKRTVEKALDLRKNKIRTFNIDRAATVKMAGETVTFE